MKQNYNVWLANSFSHAMSLHTMKNLFFVVTATLLSLFHFDASAQDRGDELKAALAKSGKGNDQPQLFCNTNPYFSGTVSNLCPQSYDYNIGYDGAYEGNTPWFRVTVEGGKLINVVYGDEPGNGGVSSLSTII